MRGNVALSRGPFARRASPPLHSSPEEGAPPLRPRVTFPSRGKSPKACQGLRPLESPGAWSPPFSRSLTHRAGLPSDTTKDRFATLRWWANRSCFFLWFHQGNTLCFQSVARQGCPRGCLKVSVPTTNTARAQGGGIKGGYAPFAGGPGTRRFLAYLCLLSLRATCQVKCNSKLEKISEGEFQLRHLRGR